MSERTEPLFSSRPVHPDDEAIEPTTIDQARLQMCAQLHRAMFGGVWARPESGAAVWAEMLDRIERARRQFQR
jgi:hypothetical protein